LDVVIGKCAAVLELLSSEDKTLLVRWDTLLVLNLALDVIDGIGRLDFKGDGLAGESLDDYKKMMSACYCGAQATRL